ncbi:MAG: FtsK/SpoIIIE domain-containing protein [Dermatophilaceae bacterium]
MAMMITLTRPGAWSTDIVVDADPLTSVRDVIKHAIAGLDPSRTPDSDVDPESVYLDDQLVDLDVPLGISGLRDGSVVTLGGPGRVRHRSSELVTVRAVAGPLAGRVWCLGAGEQQLGASHRASVQLNGGPDLVVRMRVRFDATVRVEDVSATARLDRQPLGALGAEWVPGAQLAVGTTLLEAHPVTAPDAVVEPSPEGEHLDYNRPPRLLPPERRTEFRLPAEPKPPPPAILPWLTAAVPLVFGVTMALVLDNPLYLMMAGMSPLMVLASWMSSRRGGTVGHRRRLADHRAECERIEAEVVAALEVERQDRRAASPDPAELMLIATEPRARLWERRRGDPDHLLVRVGTADQPSTVVVAEPEGAQQRQEPRTAHDVPANLSIARAGVVGLAGPEEWPRRMARWVVGQLAVLQSPRDVQVYLLTDSRSAQLWDWASWLPHVRPMLGQPALAMIGTDAETIGRRVSELLEMVQARQRILLNTGSGAVLGEPEVVVVLDGARRLRALPGVVTILKDGPGVGVFSICVESEERTLPEECASVLVGGPGRTATLSQQRAAPTRDIRVDEVGDAWFAATGRRLAPLRDVSESQSELALPAHARLLEVLEMTDPAPEAIAARWRAAGRSTRAVVGQAFDGPFALDLSAHGPHGLVAGTTGSGKSEFLQTLVASLAVENRPDEMNYVLVDYKGGAAFKDCIDLPHTVGMVTDLDSHLVERALTSLGAELTRREHILADIGAKDLEDYQDLASRRSGLGPVPRLLIVIDEFASVARELPDFVSGLVNIAQRGRSLGIHLLLATQRPTGVVSAEIRANTNLRIALRVTDAAESTDVIDAKDAASISAAHPGRAYARLGHSSLIPFQSARVGGRRVQHEDAAIAAPLLHPVSWLDLGRPAPARVRQSQRTDEVTDLSVLVAAIAEAGRRAGIAGQRQPWLPPLPETPVVELATSPEAARAGVEPAFAWAIEDLPRAQRQERVRMDLATFGHLHIAGAPRSGRSQALRTIAAAAAASSSVHDLHLFGLDCGNGALLPLAQLPHCGAVVQRTEPDRAARLLTRLNEEVARRQQLLGAGGYASLTEQRAGAADGERLPHVLLLLDRWEGFVGTLSEHDNGALTEIVHSLLREGASAGVHLVIAGDHTLLSGRISSLCESKLVLRLADPTDVSLVGINPRTLPDHIPPGRGFAVPGNVETQVALLAEDPSGPAQVARIGALAAQLEEREADVPSSRRPTPIAVLPTELTFEEAWSMVDEHRPMWALVGVGGDELTPIGIGFLEDQSTFLVAGPPRSGRTAALCVMTESLLRHDTEVVIGAPLRSRLRDFEGRPGVRGVLTDEDPSPDELADLLDPGNDPVALVVDDAELWRDITARDWLRSFVRRAPERRRAVVIGGDSAAVGLGFSGWQVDIKKNRRGALLSPQNLSDGELVGLRVPRSQLATRVVVGAAKVHLGDGTLRSVQLPRFPEPAPMHGATERSRPRGRAREEDTR